MMNIDKTKLEDAAGKLTAIGFQRQHPRIFHQVVTGSEAQYQIVLGFEEDPGTLEANWSVIQRPLSNKKLVSIDSVRVLTEQDYPEDVKAVLSKVQAVLENM